MSIVSHTQKISSTNEVRLYCDWWHASEVFLEEAKIKYNESNKLKIKTNYSYFIHASLTFSAFTLEAYINHIIPYFYKCDCKVYELKSLWDNTEIICKQLEILINYGKDPWQSIRQLFKNHRNKIAHSRTENLTDEKDYHSSYHNDRIR